MVAYDLVRRLPLADQRSDYLVDLMKLMLCKRNAGAGADKFLTVLAVRKLCIIMVLLCNGAFVTEARTSIAYIGCMGETVTSFLFKP